MQNLQNAFESDGARWQTAISVRKFARAAAGCRWLKNVVTRANSLAN